MTGPVCLDITRTLSRVGEGPGTGIDRVEAAYIRELLSSERTVFGLSRTVDGFVLLDQEGLLRFRDQLAAGEAFGSPDVISRFSRRLSATRRGAEAQLRRLAARRCSRIGLESMLKSAFPRGVQYLNVGHSNLSLRVLSAFNSVPNARIGVLVHDTIPLRRPHLQRPESVKRFRERMRLVVTHASAIVFSTEAEAGLSLPRLAPLGTLPKISVVPLGFEHPRTGSQKASVSRPPEPYFLFLSTIEPRKNLSLLLDIWGRLGPSAPHLSIVGRRGWCAPEVFSRLDELRLKSDRIHEYGAVDDVDRDWLLKGARALLFPSVDEGFGLPPVEAVLAGIPPVCAPVGAIRETLGDLAVYADPADEYQWEGIIRSLSSFGGTAGENEQGRQAGGLQLPSWQTHVCRVLSAVEQSPETLTASI